MGVSDALTEWNTTRRAGLDQLFKAHALLGGSGPGRRFSTEQINHACVMALSGQFQGFTRACWTKRWSTYSIPVFPNARGVQLQQRLAIQSGMTSNLALDRGKPTRKALEEDFRRIGIQSIAADIAQTTLPWLKIQRDTRSAHI